MLRRVAQLVRVGTFLVGALLLSLIPASLLLHVQVSIPWPEPGGSVEIGPPRMFDGSYPDSGGGGALRVIWLNDDDAFLNLEMQWNLTVERVPFQGFWMPLKPWWRPAGLVNWVMLPLWPLAVICLAWPVTSFIVARRRRRRRGFEVEARPGAAVPPPDSSPARASDT